MRIAGPRRMRPILMTSAAMALGMLPTAMGTGMGSEFRAPMGIAVIGGVISSTLLTLLVIPVIFQWMETVREFLEALWGRINGVSPTPAIRVSAGAADETEEAGVAK